MSPAVSGRLLAAAWLVVTLPAVSPVQAQPNVAQSIRYGTLVSLEKTTVQVKAGRTGTQVGATAGAVAGYAAAGHKDRWLGSLLGGAIGGAAGHAADKGASKKKGFQLIVRLEGTGQEIGVQVVGKKVDYKPGDRVRLLTGPGGQIQVSKAQDESKEDE